MTASLRGRQIAGVCAAVAVLSIPLVAQHQLPTVPPERLAVVPGLFGPPAPDEVGVLPVQGNVYMLNLGDVNIVAQVGDDGILLVDSGPAEWSDRVVRTLHERFGRRPVRYIVNTHLHPDHIGGTAAIVEAAGQGTRVIAHENTLNRMMGVVDDEPELPQEAWPTVSFFTAKKKLYFNGEPIEVLHIPSAHTDGDVMVWFRSSDVVAAGGLFATDRYPVIDETRGGSLQGHVTALNRILDITVPRFNQMGGTMVIPGHGRLSNESDVDDYRNWMTIVRDRLQDMVSKGMTLAQVKAARPTLDFDGVFENPEWTPETFLETAYRDLSRRVTQTTRAN
jgi:cyclase